VAVIYPTASHGRPGVDGDVSVIDVPQTTVVSLGFRGADTDARVARAVAKLQDWLEDHRDEYAAAGNPRRIGYNSMIVPSWYQFGEVQIPVKRATPPGER
jgi:hypothetical protein